MFKELFYKFFDFLDGKVNIKEFEQWIYNHASRDVLTTDEYMELISFNYNSKDAYYELRKILLGIMEKYSSQQSVSRETRSIKGKCISNKGRYQFNSFDTEFRMTIGKKYDILTVDICLDKDGTRYWNYTILNDDSYVHLIPSEVIKVQLSEIPEGWVVEENETGGLTIEPKYWNSGYYKGIFSFWEDFHDGEESALKEFVKVLQLMNIEVPDRYLPYALKLLVD
jgi:hypothetical protein